MVPNEDKYTKNFIKEGWASLGFALDDDYDEVVENKTAYSNNTYKYSTDLLETFNGKGGYVQILNIPKDPLNTTME